MDGKKKPKKRGRKPKNLSTESKPKIEENEITENLIIKLNKNTIDKYSISSYNENDEKNLKFLDQLNNFVMSIEKKYQNV